MAASLVLKELFNYFELKTCTLVKCGAVLPVLRTYTKEEKKVIE